MPIIDNHKDKKKVLHGEAWSFEKVCTRFARGLAKTECGQSVMQVPLQTLLYWVKINNISLAFEERENIEWIENY